MSLDVQSKNVFCAILGITCVISKFHAARFTSATSLNLSFNNYSRTDLCCYCFGFFRSEANFSWHYGYAMFGKQIFSLVFV